jgi:hypothetical protein
MTSIPTPPPLETSITGMPTSPTEAWESRIAVMLAELSQVQSDLLELLGAKSEAIANGDYPALAECTRREGELLVRLEACHAHRQQLLEAAREEGRPATSVEHLADSLEGTRRRELRQGVTDARRRMRLLQHHSLTSWVAAQRTLIHLSQMIEIVATGGKMRSTYGHREVHTGGALVDHKA